MNNKKSYRLCRIFDAGGDLEKQWYVLFYLLNLNTGKLERRREYVSLKLSAPERYSRLQALKVTIDSMLVNGELKPLNSRPSPSDLPIIDLLNRELENRRKFLVERTYRGFKNKIDVFESYLIERKMSNAKMEDITTAIARDFLVSLSLEKNWKAVTFNNYRTIFKSFFDTICDELEIDFNPFKKIKSITTTEPEIRIWNDHELEQIISYLKQNEPGLYLISLIIYYMKIRPVEIKKLKFENLDFKAGTLRVKGEGSKNKKLRVLTMPRVLSDFLIKWQNDCPPNFYIISTDLRPGIKLTHERKMQERFRKVRKELDLPVDLKLYSLKHKGNIDMHLKHGISLLKLKELNRHSSIQMTDLYMRRHLNQADQQIRDLDAGI